MGNELLGDDAVGLVAARLMKNESPDIADIAESHETGLALLDIMEGYERVILLDAIATGRCPPGTILEYTQEDFQNAAAPSLHFAGIPEILQISKRLDIPFPRELRIVAVEIDHSYDIRESISPAISKVIPGVIERVKSIILKNS